MENNRMGHYTYRKKKEKMGIWTMEAWIEGIDTD